MMSDATMQAIEVVADIAKRHADERQAAIIAWLRTIGKPQIADAIEAGEWKGQG